MALTDAQNQLLFEILEVPFSSDGQLWQLTAAGDVVGTGNSLDFHILNLAYTQILTWVSGMSGVALDSLTGLLSDWDDLGNDESSLEGGSLGGIAGLTYRAADERNRIALKVRTRVPFYRRVEELRSRRSSSVQFAS